MRKPENSMKPGFLTFRSFGLGHLVIQVLECLCIYSNCDLHLVQNSPKDFQKLALHVINIHQSWYVQRVRKSKLRLETDCSIYSYGDLDLQQNPIKSNPM